MNIDDLSQEELKLLIFIYVRIMLFTNDDLINYSIRRRITILLKQIK